MWNWKIKSKVDVNKASGDSIKNSNITINSTDSQVLMEIYHKMGRLEGEFKAVKTDIKYIRSHIEDHSERLAKVEHTLFRKD